MEDDTDTTDSFKSRIQHFALNNDIFTVSSLNGKFSLIRDSPYLQKVST